MDACCIIVVNRAEFHLEDALSAVLAEAVDGIPSIHELNAARVVLLIRP